MGLVTEEHHPCKFNPYLGNANKYVRLDFPPQIFVRPPSAALLLEAQMFCWLASGDIEALMKSTSSPILKPLPEEYLQVRLELSQRISVRPASAALSYGRPRCFAEALNNKTSYPKFESRPREYLQVQLELSQRISVRRPPAVLLAEAYVLCRYLVYEQKCV